jgi:acetylornithine deacetylase/succinyl-diaminopimelate desuccinylase-like protein
MSKKSPTQAAQLHSLSRMTISPNIIHGGLKTNIIPGEAYLDVDIRVLPEQDDEYVIHHLKKAIGKRLAKDAVLQQPEEKFTNSYGTFSNLTPEFKEGIKYAISEYYPESNIVPLWFQEHQTYDSSETWGEKHTDSPYMIQTPV